MGLGILALVHGGIPNDIGATDWTVPHTIPQRRTVSYPGSRGT